MVKGPKEKKERSLGEHLHLKGDRCNSPKCAVVRKPYKPGQHGPQGRRKQLSDFGRQVAEKQKFKVTYGLHERTLRRLFERAEESQKGTDRQLLEFMERRLDNVLFRMGLAPSRAAGRAIVIQGHIQVNGRKVRSPGYEVKNGDSVRVREESRSKAAFRELSTKLKEFQVPEWLHLDINALEGKVVGDPQIESPFEISLLVESFSK